MRTGEKIQTEEKRDKEKAQEMYIDSETYTFTPTETP